MRIACSAWLSEATANIVLSATMKPEYYNNEPASQPANELSKQVVNQQEPIKNKQSFRKRKNK